MTQRCSRKAKLYRKSTEQHFFSLLRAFPLTLERASHHCRLNEAPVVNEEPQNSPNMAHIVSFAIAILLLLSGSMTGVPMEAAAAPSDPAPAPKAQLQPLIGEIYEPVKKTRKATVSFK